MREMRLSVQPPIISDKRNTNYMLRPTVFQISSWREVVAGSLGNLDFPDLDGRAPNLGKRVAIAQLQDNPFFQYIP